MIRKVRIGGSSIQWVPALEEEEKDVIWYKNEDLQTMKRDDIKNNKRVFKEGGNPGLDAAGLTWRGFESIQEGYSREERARAYARQVVQEYKTQCQQGKELEVDKLRSFAKKHSKEERTNALKRAQQDAKDVKMQERTKSSSLSPKQDKGKIGKGVQKRTMDWFQRKNARVATEMSTLVYV